MNTEILARVNHMVRATSSVKQY